MTFYEKFFRAIAHNPVLGPKSWSTSSKAAYAEAERRISECLEKYKLFAIDDRIESKELYLSDLRALEKIPESISQLHFLERLFIGTAARNGVPHRGCKYINNIRNISTLHNLKYINISKTNVKDISPLMQLWSLEELDMEGVPVTDISPIESLPSLRSIFLTNSKVLDVRPLGKLPMANMGRSMLIALRGTPALRNDPKLELLTKFDIDKASDEIRDYLTGNHPAFEKYAAFEKESAFRDIARITPVHYNEKNSKIFAANINNIEFDKIEFRKELLSAIKSHISLIDQESQSKQIPEIFHIRLSRYIDAVNRENPSFIEMDSALSFLRGTIEDSYLLESCDLGFIDGCRQLIILHDNIRSTYVKDLQKLHDITLMAKEVPNERTANEISNDLDEIFNNHGLPVSFDESVTLLSQAIRDLGLAANEISNKDSALKKSVILVCGALAALSSFVTIQSWAASDYGIKFLTKLSEIITRILQSLGLV